MNKVLLKYYLAIKKEQTTETHDNLCESAEHYAE
jgi:hypothetical protein